MISHIDHNLLGQLKMPRATRQAGGLVGTEPKWPVWVVAEEVATLKRAWQHKATHVYFRRPSGTTRASIPQAYIFDNTRGQFTHDELTELQWKLWNSQEVPLCFIFNRDTIEILSCWAGPQFFNKRKGERKYHPNEVIELAANIQDELDRFSGEALETGAFWDDPRNAGLANHKRAAHDSLVRAVTELDEELERKHILPGPLRRKVLVTCLMLKYLEDRGVLDQADFKKFHREATELFQVLESARSFVKLVDAQAKRFNGDVFSFSPEEKRMLIERDTDLGRFAGVLDGRTSNRQRHLWKLYSFEHLPVEVISYIYQRFVKGAVGAVYTPPFLVDFLLSEAMPYEKLSSGKPWRVLDPACGSGVFLVGAFKRLVNAWRHRSHWHRPSEARLKDQLKLLLKQVHGVDMDPVAVELTMFSLSLALCDQLQPKQIRRRFRFDTLRGVTIHERDFFEFLPEAEARSEPWDLIVGNPPFVTSAFTPAARVVEETAKKKRGADGESISTPYQQTAFLFLEQSLRLVRQQATVCLLIPSTFLYSAGYADFRGSIFRRWSVPQVIDFTSVRNLFEDGDTKCCAVFLRNQPPAKGDELLHVTTRRTTATKERMLFEIDAYDFHRMDYRTAVDDPSVWKANLMGGGRVHSIAQRFLKSPTTLGQFVKEREGRGWIFRVGFIEGDTVARKPAAHLTGKDSLPTTAFTDRGIDESQIVPLAARRFRDPANPKQFEPPFLLIKLHESLPMAYWDKKYLTYGNEIAGIKAPVSEFSELRRLTKDLSRLRDLHRFFTYVTSSRLFVQKAMACRKEDLDKLPLLTEAELESALFSTADEAVIKDTLQYFGDYVRLGQESSLLVREAGDGDLRQFTEQYLSLLNSIHQKYQGNPPLRMASYTCLQFSYDGPPEQPLRADESLDAALDRLLPKKRASVRIQRILRLYSGNTIYLIKPKWLRYWIPSVAVRDADETVAELATQDDLPRSPRRLQS